MTRLLGGARAILGPLNTRAIGLLGAGLFMSSLGSLVGFVKADNERWLLDLVLALRGGPALPLWQFAGIASGMALGAALGYFGAPWFITPSPPIVAGADPSAPTSSAERRTAP